MNLSTQLCGIIIIVLLMIFYFSHNKIKTYSEKIFSSYLIITLISLISNIFLLISVGYINKRVYGLMNRIYICLLVTSVFLVLVYSLCETGGMLKNNTLILINFIIFCLSIGLILGCPKQEIIPIINKAYILSIYFICFTFISISLRINEMTRKKINIIRLWLLSWASVICIQVTYKNIDIIGFSYTICAIILFFEFENPESNLDKETKIFNITALKEYMFYLIDSHQEYNIIFIRVNPKEIGQIKRTKQIITIISNYLLDIKGINSFKAIGNEFILIIPKEYNIENIYNQIYKDLDKRINDNKYEEDYTPEYIIIIDTQYIENTDTLIKFIDEYTNTIIIENDNNPLYITKDDFIKIQEINKIRLLIKDAIDNDRIIIHLQPIFDIKRQKFISAEVLARLQDRDGKIIEPTKFIDIAEKTGLILEIEHNIFEKACQFIKANPLEQLGLEYLELNLSVRKGESEKLIHEYDEIVKKYNINPSQLNLEITETATLNEKRKLLNNMFDLIDYGISFSLDDFGSGESNLNYIIDMPITIIKFDREMTNNYFINNKAKIVMNNAINMAHCLGLKVVIEGIETKDQYETMKQLNVDYIQGYYFSKPLNESRFLSFIKENYENKPIYTI